MDQIPVRPDGLQLDEDRRFQERYWTVERGAWTVFALILLAALIGTTGGGGVLSRQSFSTPEGAVVAPRVARWATTDRLEVTFAAGGRRRSLTLDQEFLRSFQIETVTPEPDSSVALPAGVRLEFETADGPSSATLHVRPDRVGRAAYRVAIDEREAVDVITWILP